MLVLLWIAALVGVGPGATYGTAPVHAPIVAPAPDDAILPTGA